MIILKKLICVWVLFLGIANSGSSQVTVRERPKSWDSLVIGARFIDRFLPMPDGKLSSDVWGAKNVIPRYIDNGIEDNVRSYWGGNILKEADGKYHLFVCGWPENSPKGHMYWPHSTVFHTVSDNPIGPFNIVDTVGKGHNPEAFRTRDGIYIIYVIDGYYKAQNINGPWTYHKFDFDRRDRNIIEGLTNLTFAQRGDGSCMMVCRGGGVWFSRDGISTYNQITDRRVYPPVEGEFEDPVIWRDNVQYHLIVNDWKGRIAFYLRSKDGVKWITDPGEAYALGIARHKNGHVEDWYKLERAKVFQDEYGRAIQMNFAVIDTIKWNDLENDNHSSKNIGIPLNKGILMEMMNTQPITKNTKQISIKVKAEDGFNPQTDMDFASLRFGASTEVNFGRGSQLSGTKNEGKDIILFFDAKNSGITAEEFAPKLIGKDRQGKMLFGFTRVPWMNYSPPILSAREPVFTQKANTTDIKIMVENFGETVSAVSQLQLFYLQKGKEISVGKTAVPALEPFAATDVSFTVNQTFETGKEYPFMIKIVAGREISTYKFKKKF